MKIVCRSFLKKKSFFLYKTKKIPEFIWPSKENIRKTSCNLYLCNYCGHLQLQKFNIKRIKSFYGKKTFVIPNTKEQKVRKKKIIKNFGKNYFNRRILEIGGGTNPFLQKYNKNHFIIDYKIEKKVKQMHGSNAVEGSFEKYNKKKFDIFILFHTLEHFQNPSAIIEKIKKISNDKSEILIEVPNFINYVLKKPYYAIFHQHLSMFTKNTLINIFSINGFSVKKIFNSKENIFICFKKGNCRLNIKNEYLKNSLLVKKLKTNLNKIETFLKKFFTRYGYKIIGAGGSTTLLINNFPFLIDRIYLAYDNDKNKIGKFIPGTKIKIFKGISKYKNRSVNLFKLIEKII